MSRIFGLFCAVLFLVGCVPVTYPLIGDNEGDVHIPGDLHVGGDIVSDGDISADNDVIADADNDNGGEFVQSPAGNENVNENDNDNTGDNENDNSDGHPLPNDEELEVDISAPASGIFDLNQEITFSGSWTGGTPPFRVKWFFPDQESEIESDFSGREHSTIKKFTIPGGGPVRLIITDSEGDEVSRAVNLTIR